MALSRLRAALGRLEIRVDGWSERRFRRVVLGGLVAFALIHLAAFVLLTRPGPDERWLGSVSYGDIARHLVAGRGFSMDGVHPTAWRPPVYPLLLAGVMKLAGGAWLAVALALQAALGVIAGWLVVALSEALFARRIVALLAAGLYVTDGLFQFEVLAQRETIVFTVALLAWLLTVARGVRGPAEAAALAGLAGLVYLTRPTGLFVALLTPVLLLAAVRRSETRRPVAALGAAAVVFLACALPWHLHVLRAFETLSFLPTSTSGLMLYKGTVPDLDDVYPMADVDLLDPWIERRLEARGLAHDEVGANRWLREEGLRHLRERPGHWLGRAAVKVGALWSPLRTPFGTGDLVEDPDGRFRLEGFSLVSPLTVLFAPHALLVLLGSIFFAARAARARFDVRGTLVTVGALVAIVTALHAATVGETRYRLFFDPLLALFTAASIAGVPSGRRTGRSEDADGGANDG